MKLYCFVHYIAYLYHNVIKHILYCMVFCYIYILYMYVHVNIIIVCSLHWDFQYVLYCMFYLIAYMYTHIIAFVLIVVCAPALTAPRSLPGCGGAAEKFRGGQNIQIRPGIVWCKRNKLRVLFSCGPFDPRNILSTCMTLFRMVPPSFSLIQTWLFDPHGWFLIGPQGKTKRLDSDAFKVLNS